MTDQTEDDWVSQEDCASVLGEKWNCEIRNFGKTQEVDWYAVRDERMVAVLELKVRTHKHDQFETVFLSVRKWLSLWLASMGFGAKPLYVVGFTDGIWALPLPDIDIWGMEVKMGGRKDRGKSNDWEPIIHVPVSLFEKVL